MTQALGNTDIKASCSNKSPSHSVGIATSEHIRHVPDILKMIEQSAIERGTGRGKREPREIVEKILKGQAIIAETMLGAFIGFCYVEAYEQGAYFANSALVVAHDFRGIGISRKIKLAAFTLGRTLFPHATPITITTSPAVLKLNHELGYRPVSFSEITSDPAYWKGCKSCVNYDVLCRTKGKNCVCTAMKMDLPETTQGQSSSSWLRLLP